MGKVLFEAKLTAPVADASIDLHAEEWVEGMNASIENEIKGLDEAIKKAEALADSMKDPFNKKMITNMTIKGLKRAKEKLLEKGGADKFKRNIAESQSKYDESIREYWFPIAGSTKAKIKGLAALGVMALSGDQDLYRWLKMGLDNIVTGLPRCICAPERLTEFKNALKNQLTSSGPILIRSKFLSEGMKSHNERLNKLVDGYRTEEYAPFAPDGDSHINFVVREIEGKRRLGLDIKVTLEK